MPWVENAKRNFRREVIHEDRFRPHRRSSISLVPGGTRSHTNNASSFTEKVSWIENMPRVEVLVLCDAVLRDPSGKFELRGIFDRVITMSLPAFHREMFLFFRFYGDPGSLSASPVMRCEVSLPDGQRERLPDLSPKIDHLGKVEGFLKLQGFPLTQLGEHRVHLYLDGQHIGYYRFECVNPNSPQGGPPDARIN